MSDCLTLLVCRIMGRHRPRLSVTVDEKTADGLEGLAEDILKDTGDRSQGAVSQVADRGLTFYLRIVDEIGFLPEDGLFSLPAWRALVTEYRKRSRGEVESDA